MRTSVGARAKRKIGFGKPVRRILRKDPGSFRHVTRAAETALEIFKQMKKDKIRGINRISEDQVFNAGINHDNAKGEWPKKMFIKSRLNEEERQVILNHPKRSMEITEKHGIEDKTTLSAIRDHHERLDGRGYPFAKKGEEISVLARILSVADSYSAMLERRVYKKGEEDEIRGGHIEKIHAPAEAVAQLLKEAKLRTERLGAYDPVVVKSFIKYLLRTGTVTKPRVVREIRALKAERGVVKHFTGKYDVSDKRLEKLVEFVNAI